MFSILPSLYPRRLAAITPAYHTVTVLNERYQPVQTEKHYDLVNIHFTTASALKAYQVADTFRKKGVKVVLSGLHASALPEEAKQHADSILLGRGELNWLTLLKDMENNKLKEIYPPEDFTASQTKIPPTHVKLPGFMMTGAVEATRGCPYKCTFCPESNTPNGDKFYARPVDEIINELKTMPQKTIMFYDASLTINPSYTKELFTRMKSLKKKFFCNGNVDVLAHDEELVQLSKDAGCLAWLVGFESFSQETIDKVGKTTNKVDIYRKAVQNIHKHGMAVIGDFIFGFDTDTPTVFTNTLHAIKKLEIDVADFTILTPFPGTPLFTQLKEEGRLLTEDWSQYTLHTVVFKPKNMSVRELQEGVRTLYQKFYSPQESLKRVIRGFQLGFHPFLVILSRNLIANFNRKNIAKSKR